MRVIQDDQATLAAPWGGAEWVPDSSIQRSELRALTGLRGLAALTVALAHYSLPIAGPFNRLFYWHNAAVDLFFCLSGFTLGLVYGQQRRTGQGFGNYVVARVARIYPLYLATLLWVALIKLPISSDYTSAIALQDFLAQIATVNSWPIVGTGTHWNVPSWSISVEMFCYLFVFPVLWCTRASTPPWVSACVVGLCTILSFIAVTQYVDWRIVEAGSHRAAHWSAYVVNTTRGIIGFVSGWLVWSIYREKSVLNDWAKNCTWAVALGMASIVVASAVVGTNINYIIFLFPLLILGLANGNSSVASALSGPLAHRLGLYSYSIYLTHIPVRMSFDFLVVKYGWRWSDTSYSVALISALLAVSSLSFHAFEVPWRRIIRRHLQSSATPEKGTGLLALRQGGPAVLIAVSLLIASGVYGFKMTRALRPGSELVTSYTYFRVFTQGWSGFEGTHIWGVGGQSAVEVELPTTRSARVAIRGRAFVTAAHPRQVTTISVNGIAFGTVEATMEAPLIAVDLPVSSGAESATILFETKDPVSPLALGIAPDARKLSIAITSLKIH